MKERTLTERILLLLNVILGSLGWILRLIWRTGKDMLANRSASPELPARTESASESLSGVALEREISSTSSADIDGTVRAEADSEAGLSGADTEPLPNLDEIVSSSAQGDAASSLEDAPQSGAEFDLGAAPSAFGMSLDDEGARADTFAADGETTATGELELIDADAAVASDLGLTSDGTDAYTSDFSSELPAADASAEDLGGAVESSTSSAVAAALADDEPFVIEGVCGLQDCDPEETYTDQTAADVEAEAEAAADETSDSGSVDMDDASMAAAWSSGAGMQVPVAEPLSVDETDGDTGVDAMSDRDGAVDADSTGTEDAAPVAAEGQPVEPTAQVEGATADQSRDVAYPNDAEAEGTVSASDVPSNEGAPSSDDAEQYEGEQAASAAYGLDVDPAAQSDDSFATETYASSDGPVDSGFGDYGLNPSAEDAPVSDLSGIESGFGVESPVVETEPTFSSTEEPQFGDFGFNPDSEQSELTTSAGDVIVDDAYVNGESDMVQDTILPADGAYDVEPSDLADFGVASETDMPLGVSEPVTFDSNLATEDVAAPDLLEGTEFDADYEPSFDADGLKLDNEPSFEPDARSLDDDLSFDADALPLDYELEAETSFENAMAMSPDLDAPVTDVSADLAFDEPGVEQQSEADLVAEDLADLSGDPVEDRPWDEDVDVPVTGLADGAEVSGLIDHQHSADVVGGTEALVADGESLDISDALSFDEEPSDVSVTAEPSDEPWDANVANPVSGLADNAELEALDSLDASFTTDFAEQDREDEFKSSEDLPQFAPDAAAPGGLTAEPYVEGEFREPSEKDAFDSTLNVAGENTPAFGESDALRDEVGGSAFGVVESGTDFGLDADAPFGGELSADTARQAQDDLGGSFGETSFTADEAPVTYDAPMSEEEISGLVLTDDRAHEDYYVEGESESGGTEESVSGDEGNAEPVGEIESDLNEGGASEDASGLFVGEADEALGNDESGQASADFEPVGEIESDLNEGGASENTSGLFLGENIDTGSAETFGTSLDAYEPIGEIDNDLNQDASGLFEQPSEDSASGEATWKLSDDIAAESGGVASFEPIGASDSGLTADLGSESATAFVTEPWAQPEAADSAASESAEDASQSETADSVDGETDASKASGESKDDTSAQHTDEGTDKKDKGRKTSPYANSVLDDGTHTVPEGYPVKGNGNSRIYHLPGEPSYAPTKAEYYFATPEDAKRAGFRPVKH